MTTLILSTWSLPAATALAGAAQQAGWLAYAAEECPNRQPSGKIVFYGGTDKAIAISKQFHLALLEPPFDLLAKLPLEFRRRTVEYGRFSDVDRLKSPAFVKPADALNKNFDAGIYSSTRDIRAITRVDAHSPILLAEPVEWSAEYRCFIAEGEVAAWSPYVSFGRPIWKPFCQGTLAAKAPPSVLSFCDRLFTRSKITLPPAFVMDVGVIDDRGWAVVEFNPVWCSGVLGADPHNVLAVLERASQDEQRLRADDRRWLVERSPQLA